MEEKMSGIVLGGISFGENDKILKIFTLEQGVVSAKIKGVKKAGAKLKFASEPFCFAEFIFSKNLDKRTVIGASLIDSFYPVREDIKKFFAGGTVLDFARRFYRESWVEAQDFFNVINALKSISYGDNPLSALCAFLISALDGAGIKLTLEGCFYCQTKIEGKVFFDYRAGAFLCEECFSGTGREINPITLDALCLAKEGRLTDGHAGAVKALRLLEYYLENRADEKLNALKELLQIC